MRTGHVRQLHQSGHHFSDHPVFAGLEALTEVTDAAQPRWQLNLDAGSRGEIDRVVGMEPEAHPLVSDVISGKAVA